MLARKTGVRIGHVRARVETVAEMLVSVAHTGATMQADMLALTANVHLMLAVEPRETIAADAVLEVGVVCLVEVWCSLGDLLHIAQVLGAHAADTKVLTLERAIGVWIFDRYIVVVLVDYVVRGRTLPFNDDTFTGVGLGPFSDGHIFIEGIATIDELA